MNFKTEYENKCYKLFLSMLNNIQRKENEKMYIDKKPSDIMVCQLCNGNYTRANKTKHEKSKYHKKRLDKLFNFVNSN